jgi:hypothetical protein
MFFQQRMIECPNCWAAERDVVKVDAANAGALHIGICLPLLLA